MLHLATHCASPLRYCGYAIAVTHTSLRFPTHPPPLDDIFRISFSLVGFAPSDLLRRICSVGFAPSDLLRRICSVGFCEVVSVKILRYRSEISNIFLQNISLSLHISQKKFET